MIRVFPRRTKWTPIDSRAFVGHPPVFRPQRDVPVYVSCAFTWDIPEAERLYRSWSRFYSDVRLGGPAFDDTGENFSPGVFIREGVTITSRGCTKECPWCLVPRREGWIRELPIQPGNNVADNNLLACSPDHVRRVFDMLAQQALPIKFSGGLDAEILDEWHVDLLKRINLKFAWFACDYPGAVKHLEKVAQLMTDFSVEKKRCYVLIGWNGETPYQAEKRLERVYDLGFLPFSMLYRGPDLQKDMWNKQWREIHRLWTHPAAYRKRRKEKAVC